MKQKLFLSLMAIVAVLAMVTMSCNRDAGAGAMYAPSRAWVKTVVTLDTLNNAETITQTLGTYLSPIYYEVQVSADSISGATAGTATLQQSIDDGTTWYDLGSVTINGVSTRGRISGNVLGGTLRLSSVSTGTQVTTLRTAYIIAGKPE